jgi:hypothetical protein
MVLGVACSNIVVQQFKIHKEILKFVFTQANMPTANVITTSVKSSTSKGTPLAGRAVNEAPTTSDAKGKQDRGFIGKMCRIPIPLAAGAELHKYFNSSANRKNVYIMFPKLATNGAIAMWIAQHADPSFLSKMGVFYNDRGVKVSFDPTIADWTANDVGTITKLLGKFGATFTARLTDEAVTPAP